ncbi:hypothetical protein O3M35_002480 [Rhynocoris fuscipes]|uniref:Uncharacterized protein n=1 Tax=Rhynocoris fuscipes TaxID=488301 RepID=A0AAW1CNZ2_9HEMI
MIGNIKMEYKNFYLSWLQSFLRSAGYKIRNFVPFYRQHCYCWSGIFKILLKYAHR